MSLLDVKREPLEKILDSGSISYERARRIRMEIPFYDEYYLTPSNKIIKVFRQEFNGDPYMDLPPMKDLRLVDYQLGVEVDELMEVFSLKEMPGVRP